MLHIIIKLELLTMRSNTIAVKSSRMFQTGLPNAGLIANDDWLVRLLFCNVIGESHEWNVARAETPVNQ